MMIRRGSDHSFQYWPMVMSSLLPFICIAPSPTRAMATRSGNANLAAITYGTPGPIVASPPESEAIMPSRIFRSRAYQLAEEPESDERMQLSGSRDESSQNTRSGLIGSAAAIARDSSTCHH